MIKTESPSGCKEFRCWILIHKNFLIVRVLIMFLWVNVILTLSSFWKSTIMNRNGVLTCDDREKYTNWTTFFFFFFFANTGSNVKLFIYLTYEHLRTFTSRVLRTFTSRVLRTFTSRVLRIFTSRVLRTFTSRVLRTFNSRVLRTRIHSEIILAVSPEIHLSSMNCVNLCKFVASFPSDFAVSCTSDLL